MEVCLNFEKKKKQKKKNNQSTVSQHPENNYGNLVSERFSHSFTEFRIITSFCTTASGLYLRKSGFV